MNSVIIELTPVITGSSCAVHPDKIVQTVG